MLRTLLGDGRAAQIEAMVDGATTETPENLGSVPCRVQVVHSPSGVGDPPLLVHAIASEPVTLSTLFGALAGEAGTAQSVGAIALGSLELRELELAVLWLGDDEAGFEPEASGDAGTVIDGVNALLDGDPCSGLYLSGELGLVSEDEDSHDSTTLPALLARLGGASEASARLSGRVELVDGLPMLTLAWSPTDGEPLTLPGNVALDKLVLGTSCLLVDSLAEPSFLLLGELALGDGAAMAFEATFAPSGDALALSCSTAQPAAVLDALVGEAGLGLPTWALPTGDDASVELELLLALDEPDLRQARLGFDLQPGLSWGPLAVQDIQVTLDVHAPLSDERWWMLDLQLVASIGGDIKLVGGGSYPQGLLRCWATSLEDASLGSLLDTLGVGDPGLPVLSISHLGVEVDLHSGEHLLDLALEGSWDVLGGGHFVLEGLRLLHDTREARSKLELGATLQLGEIGLVVTGRHVSEQGWQLLLELARGQSVALSVLVAALSEALGLGTRAPALIAGLDVQELWLRMGTGDASYALAAVCGDDQDGSVAQGLGAGEISIASISLRYAGSSEFALGVEMVGEWQPVPQLGLAMKGVSFQWSRDSESDTIEAEAVLILGELALDVSGSKASGGEPGWSLEAKSEPEARLEFGQLADQLAELFDLQLELPAFVDDFAIADLCIELNSADGSVHLHGCIGGDRSGELATVLELPEGFEIQRLVLDVTNGLPERDEPEESADEPASGAETSTDDQSAGNERSWQVTLELTVSHDDDELALVFVSSEDGWTIRQPPDSAFDLPSVAGIASAFGVSEGALPAWLDSEAQPQLTDLELVLGPEGHAVTQAGASLCWPGDTEGATALEVVALVQRTPKPADDKDKDKDKDEGKQARPEPAWRHVVAALPGLEFGLGSLPLVGSRLNGVGVSGLQLWHLSPGFDQLEVALQDRVGQAPDELEPGLTVLAQITGLGEEPHELRACFPTEEDEDEPDDGDSEAEGAAQPVEASGVDAAAGADQGAGDSDEALVRLGPVTIEHLGLALDGSALQLVIDGSLAMGGLQLSLDGLGVGMELGSWEPSFGLEGLGLDFRQGEIEIAGAFLRKDDDYLGELLMHLGEYSLTAIGGYSPNHGHPSLFLYAHLDATLGGPAFCFVTGAAAGFGIERALQIPSIEELSSFPLLPANAPAMPAAGGVTGDTMSALTGVLSEIESCIPPATGQHWIAVGLDFTSFELVKTSAILTVSFGRRFELNLLGLSHMSVPSEATNPIAYAELAIKASYAPEDGALRVTGQLTSASYLFEPNCRLTGGFAFCTWFTGEHAGDFVVTLGGYHPHFSLPAHYPRVPRLGISWDVDSHLQIKGEEYYALTPGAIMAGGGLHATWHSGDLKAWFDAEAHFLMGWKPFHYEAFVHIGLGVSYRVDLWFTSFTVSVHVGVDLNLHGPPFGGTARVDLSVVSFTIAFGADRSEPEWLTWGDFAKAFLPDDKLTARVTRGLIRALQQPTENEPHWLASPELLQLELASVVPATLLKWGDEVLNVEATQVGIRPMGPDQDGVTSTLTVTLTRQDDPVIQGDGAGIIVEPLLRSVPASLWGKSGEPGLDADGVIQDAICGITLHTEEPRRHATCELQLEGLLFDNHDRLPCGPGAVEGDAGDTATTASLLAVMSTLESSIAAGPEEVA